MYNNPSSELISASIEDMQSPEYQKREIPQKLQKLIEMENIATSLDEEELTKIAALVISSTEEDEQSRQEWTSSMEKAFKLINAKLEDKNTPWAGAANIKYPLIIESCMQFNARTLPEIIKNDQVVKIAIIGKDNVLPPQMPMGGPPGPEGPQPIGVPAEPGPPLQQPQPGPQPIGVPAPPGAQQAGPQQGPMPKPPIDQESDRAQRLSDHMSYQLLAQSDHWKADTDRLLMILPMVGVVYRKSFFNSITGHPDTELCLPSDIVVNNNIKSLESALRITHKMTMSSNQLIEAMRAGIYTDYPLEELRNQPKKPEELRVDQGMAASISTDDELHDIAHQLEEQHRFLDLDDDGYQEPYIVTVHIGSQKVLRIKARYDEEDIEFNDKGKFIRINPKHYFTDYHLIRNPDGTFHSFGFGILLMALNEMINTISNQLLDAGTLSNRQSGFIGDALRIPSGDYSFRPGEWKKVKSPIGGNIGANVFPLPLKEPSPTLFQLLNFLIEAARGITSVSEVMQGEAPAANTPAATTLALVEQGQKVFGAILLRIYDSLKKEFTKLYKINKKYMAEEETFPLAVGTGMVTLQDYQAPNFGIYPVANPNLSSHIQRLMQAQALMQLIGNPMINPLPIVKNYLEVLRVDNIDEILIENPPPNPQEILALKGQAAEVKMAELQPAFEMMKYELDAIGKSIDEIEAKSKTAYFGGQLAGNKIDKAIDIAKTASELGPQAFPEALTEEEQITRGTQIQDIPMDVYQRISQLEGLINQMLTGTQQTIAPHPQGGPQQGPGGPPPGMPEQQEPGAEGAPMPPEGQ